MLKIKQYPTGPLSVNTYLVCDEISKECIIIDLGGEIDKIYKEINELGGKLKYILNTHGGKKKLKTSIILMFIFIKTTMRW